MNFKSFIATASLLILATASLARAGLTDRKGIWDLNGNLAGYWPCYAPLDASTLTSGTDYSFGSDGAGYQFLQTQIFATSARRLTVPNPSGPNGGPGATRTNQWTVVMDVKFDALQPYAGLLQLDPANALDVSMYVFSTNNVTGTLTSGIGALSTSGAIAVNTWQRLAITCSNNGAGGATSVQFYLNGSPNGVPRASTFDGPFSLRPTFHLFSDNNAELKPAKLGSLGLWGEALSGADIASLGGPSATGILPPGLTDPLCPTGLAIPWSTLDGGGARSTGGLWTLTGTIGQPDATASKSSGGAYAVQGGFWPGQVVLPGGPVLSFTQMTATQVTVSWTAAAAGQKLQYSTDLVTWTDLVTGISGASSFAWPLASGRRYYFRLHPQ